MRLESYSDPAPGSVHPLTLVCWDTEPESELEPLRPRSATLEQDTGSQGRAAGGAGGSAEAPPYRRPQGGSGPHAGGGVLTDAAPSDPDPGGGLRRGTFAERARGVGRGHGGPNARVLGTGAPMVSNLGPWGQCYSQGSYRTLCRRALGECSPKGAWAIGWGRPCRGRHDLVSRFDTIRVPTKTVQGMWTWPAERWG